MSRQRLLPSALPSSGAGKYLDPLNRPRTVHGFRLKQKLADQLNAMKVSLKAA
jgi:hypothetical protein